MKKAVFLVAGAMLPIACANAGEVINISTRGFVGSSPEQQLIAGFVIRGTTPKVVVVRAKGPSLPISGSLSDPTLVVVNQANKQIIAENDDWENAPDQQDIVEAGLEPTDRLESAVILTLDPGAYTALVSGYDGATGISVVSVNDVDICRNNRFYGTYFGYGRVGAEDIPTNGDAYTPVTEEGVQYTITIGDDPEGTGPGSYIYLPRCGVFRREVNDSFAASLVVDGDVIRVHQRNFGGVSESLSEGTLIFSEDLSQVELSQYKINAWTGRVEVTFSTILDRE